MYERGNIFRHPFRICPYRTNIFKTVQSTGNLYLRIGVVFMGNLSVKGKFQGVSTLVPTRGWLLPSGWIIQAAQWPLGLRIPLRKTHRAKNMSYIQFFKKGFHDFIIFFQISSPFNRILMHFLAFVKTTIHLLITKTYILKKTIRLVIILKILIDSLKKKLMQFIRYVFIFSPFLI